MKFDVYGRLQIEVVRDGESWTAYQLEPGKRIVALKNLSLAADTM